jgi:hypothetical protein
MTFAGATTVDFGPHRLMSTDPYRAPPEPPPGDENTHPVAMTALSIALGSTIVAWFVLGDRAPNGNELVLGLFVTSVVLVAGWRAGKGR